MKKIIIKLFIMAILAFIIYSNNRKISMETNVEFTNSKEVGIFVGK